MADMIPMGKLLAAAKKEYPNLNTEELTALIGLQIEAKQAEVNALMKSSNKGGYKLAKAKGGNISNQMEMFEEGGLKDEGGTVDPISGNDVPSGSTQEEVRDDIPAQLSEGEFVFPADVVRYLGLEKLMTLRQEAKQGLKTMEDMGQMGNSEEATMRDDMPFDINDIDMDDDEEYNSEDMEMARGGVVYAATGFGGTTTSNNQLGSRASSFGNTATRTPQPKTYTPPPIPTAAPTGGFTYGKPKEDGEGKLTFDNLFKDAGGADEYKTYVNDAGAEIQVPFRNGKILTGFTVPEGFKLKSEKVDTAKTQSTKVKSTRPTEEDSNDPGPSLTEQGFREGQNVTFMGGTNVNGRRTGSRDIGVKIDIPGGIMSLGGITGALMAGITGNYPKGTMMGVTIKGDPGKIKYVTPAKYKELMKDPKKGDTFLDSFAKERSIVDDEGPRGISKDERIDSKLTADKDFMDEISNINKGITDDSFKDSAPTVPDDIGTVDNTDSVDSGGDSSGGWSDSGDDTGTDSGGSVGDTGYGGGGGPGDFNIGGLASKKKQKIKVKKMKQGGLASRK